MSKTILLDGKEYGLIARDNCGYDVMMLMTKWTPKDWESFGRQIARVGLSGMVRESIAKFDDEPVLRAYEMID